MDIFKIGKKYLQSVDFDKINWSFNSYEGEKCLARLWDKGKYGKTQCSNVKKENSCYCIKHYNASLRMNNKWWLGLITDERPESPIHPISGKHNWSKDKDGNDYIKELKKEEKKEAGEGKIKIKRPRGRPKGSKNKVKNLNLI